MIVYYIVLIRSLFSRTLTPRLFLVFETLGVKVVSFWFFFPLDVKVSLRPPLRSVDCDHRGNRPPSQSPFSRRPSGSLSMLVVCSCCPIRPLSTDHRRVDRRDVMLQSLHSVTLYQLYSFVFLPNQFEIGSN